MDLKIEQVKIVLSINFAEMATSGFSRSTSFRVNTFVKYFVLYTVF